MTVEREGETGCLTLSGELDPACLDRFEEQFRSVTAEDGVVNVILDVRSLSAIDSPGLELIRSIWERARGDGFNLILVRASSQVRSVFELSGLDQLLPVAYERPDGDGRG